ncbi:hypothetical protein CAI21_07785 [Alkalilimnicola ehrlichii]|uniref:Uncharacterized protein n=1 Tax=Alkalilimnicola ehrlichii TaxID=351052 RepID=A0A3E0WXB0_9GAMM|nr:hypothetical protein [Alkalilimnicola ehrlichii]RFA30093.1 hypothetical protein CAI21_07785 [Alkalilimnicola ehrlichii]RFA37438.1 hypothetical protein CAL65_09125 [Alkalilimnicola ehrlichii]
MKQPSPPAAFIPQRDTLLTAPAFVQGLRARASPIWGSRIPRFEETGGRSPALLAHFMVY